MSLLDAETVHHRQQILGHLVDGIANEGVRALTSPAMIVKDDLIFLRKRRNVRVPVAALLRRDPAPADGRSATIRFVIDIGVGNSDFGHKFGCLVL